MRDIEYLNEFCESFLGYGNPSSAVWFIGMEEGGGHTAEEVRRRLRFWHENGRKSFEDAAEFHRAIGMPELFRATRPKRSRTWTQLIKILLANQGLSSLPKDIWHYQATSWAREASDHCLLELLPLPSPSTKRWLYSEISSDPLLASRKTYVSKILEFRINLIKSKIHEHTPRVVLFYGLTYERHWREIAQSQFSVDPVSQCKVSGNGTTRFVVMRHPTARRLAGQSFDFSNVGHLIRGLA